MPQGKLHALALVRSMRAQFNFPSFPVITSSAKKILRFVAPTLSFPVVTSSTKKILRFVAPSAVILERDL